MVGDGAIGVSSESKPWILIQCQCLKIVEREKSV